VSAPESCRIQLRDQPELQRGLYFLIIGMTVFGLCMVALLVVKSPGVVTWLLGGIVVAGTVIVVANPAPRRVQEAELTPVGIQLKTASGRMYHVGWNQAGIFIDVTVPSQDGTIHPGPMVHWGRLGLPVSWITLESARLRSRPS
jgi:hypothetical protein